ncbi:hypothetical protein HWV62_13215 [Athelia sp. TMB]|nr:hypothetical protein HWV62_13215 [Athelia sp. TMB]
MSDLAAVEVWGGSFDSAVGPANGGSARTSIDQPGSALARRLLALARVDRCHPLAHARLGAADAERREDVREDVPPQRAPREHRRVHRLLRGGDLRVTAHLPHASEYTPHPDRLEPTPPSRDVHQGS